jgi:hypothetical protein
MTRPTARRAVAGKAGPRRVLKFPVLKACLAGSWGNVPFVRLARDLLWPSFAGTTTPVGIQAAAAQQELCTSQLVREQFLD